MKRYVWCTNVGQRGFYARGHSRSHSRKIWRELPDYRRRIQQSLRNSIRPSERQVHNFAYVDPTIVFGSSR